MLTGPLPVKTGFFFGRILGLVTQHIYRLHNRAALSSDKEARVGEESRQRDERCREAVVENAFDASDGF